MEALEEDELSDSSYALTKADVGNGRIMFVSGCIIAYGEDLMLHCVRYKMYLYLVVALTEGVEFYVVTSTAVENSFEIRVRTDVTRRFGNDIFGTIVDISVIVF